MNILEKKINAVTPDIKNCEVITPVNDKRRK